METIEKNGVSYVIAREIERHYKFTRKRAWQELQKAKLPYMVFLHTHFYKLTDVKNYFDNLDETDGRKLKNKKNKEGLV